MSVLTITADNFEQEVLNASAPVLIDFWATWCGPCQMMGPIVDAFSESHPQVVVGKVNVDEQPQLAAAFGIQSIPTLVVLKEGKLANMAVGVQTEEQLEDLLAK